MKLDSEAWWWTLIVYLSLRVDNIQGYGVLHPDGEIPPKDTWLDDDRLKEWEKDCEKLRERKAKEKQNQPAW